MAIYLHKSYKGPHFHLRPGGESLVMGTQEDIVAFAGIVQQAVHDPIVLCPLIHPVCGPLILPVMQHVNFQPLAAAVKVFSFRARHVHLFLMMMQSLRTQWSGSLAGRDQDGRAHICTRHTGDWSTVSRTMQPSLAASLAVLSPDCESARSSPITVCASTHASTGPFQELRGM